MFIFANDVYKKRRKKLLSLLSRGEALICGSSPLCIRSADVHYPYRPHSNMIYFTGIEEDLSCLLLIHDSKGKSRQILFVKEKDPVKALWVGEVMGPETAGDITQVDLCYGSCQFLPLAGELLQNISSLYYSFSDHSEWNEKIKQLLLFLKDKAVMGPSVKDSTRLIASLRVKKEPQEIEKIKQAVDIATKGHRAVMSHIQPRKTEKMMEDIFLATIKTHGAKEVCYPSIFASGNRACILHYTQNKAVLKNHELLLVDAGAEYHYYASDISRTFPINGKFSKLQKRIYNKLLNVQKTLIQQIKVGDLFIDIQNKACELLSQVMIEEKILTSSLKKVLKTKEYKKYFPHNIGHSMGLDVHDIVLNKPGSPLKCEPGFVFTIEPGLYFPPHDTSLAVGLRGMGLRIEDDILITPKGAQVLSHKAPKEVEELEELLGSHG